MVPLKCQQAQILKKRDAVALTVTYREPMSARCLSRCPHQENRGGAVPKKSVPENCSSTSTNTFSKKASTYTTVRFFIFILFFAAAAAAITNQ